MPALDDLPPRSLAAAAELTARLKHDLGKYVSFGARWLPPDADLEARTQALGDDLLRTRRGPQGEQDAIEVWTPYLAQLIGEALDLADDADVVRIIAGMNRLEPLVAQLRAGQSIPEAEVDAGLATCREVSNACRELHRRAQEASRNHG